MLNPEPTHVPFQAVRVRYLDSRRFHNYEEIIFLSDDLRSFYKCPLLYAESSFLDSAYACRSEAQNFILQWCASQQPRMQHQS